MPICNMSCETVNTYMVDIHYDFALKLIVLLYVFIHFVGTDERKIVVIGKSRRPRCFENVDKIYVLAQIITNERSLHYYSWVLPNRLRE